MQVRWHDIVIVDYEADFPAATNYELSLYSSGLQLFPKVVLGTRQVWGQERRAGLVDIPAPEYEEILGAFAANCLTYEFIRRMSATLAKLISSISRACDSLDGALASGHPAKVGLLESTTGRLNHLMAFHVLNWALPIDQIVSRLQLLLGSRSAARENLLSLIVPITSSHLLDAPGAPGSKDRTALVHTLGLHSERQAQQLAYRTLSMWLRSHGNADDLAFLTNLARLGRLVAEEEEQRRRIQDRWMTIIASTLPVGVFQQEPELPAPPRLLPDSDHSWDWLK